MKRFFLTVSIVLMAACWPDKAENADSRIVFEKETVKITARGENRMKAELTVEIADTKAKRMRGLMYRTELADGAGMLFLFPKSQKISMWMANTPLSLDMLFIDNQGRIQKIVENTVPFSHDEISSGKKALGVLEIKGGEAKRFDLQSGDIVEHPFFKLAKPE